MFKRRERFTWPSYEPVVQIPPDLPMKQPVVMKIDMATGEDHTHLRHGAKILWPPGKIAEFKRKVFENKKIEDNWLEDAAVSFAPVSCSIHKKYDPICPWCSEAIRERAEKIRKDSDK